MTVRQLIEELSIMDKDALVVLSSDSEGNSYSPLSWVEDLMSYHDDSTYQSEVFYSHLTPELEEQGLTKEDIVEGGQKCIVLYPVN